MFKIETKHQKEQRIIQNIHDDFDNAQDCLLNQAKELLSSYHTDDVQENEKIADRLMKIGFTNVPVVKQISTIKTKRREKEIIILRTKAEAELIEYYKFKYPFLKFLTESELDKICTKYGLIYAPIGKYIKDVPEKNLIDIEKVQSLDSKDKSKDKYLLKINSFWNTCPREIRNFLEVEIEWKKGNFYSDDSCLEMLKDLGYKGNYTGYVTSSNGATITKIDKGELFICAPPTHFDITGLKKIGLGFFEFTKTEINDPIVFRYVNGGIQVITKWGLEASDDMLANPINN